jgi:hypothetical protein
MHARAGQWQADVDLACIESCDPEGGCNSGNGAVRSVRRDECGVSGSEQRIVSLDLNLHDAPLDDDKFVMCVAVRGPNAVADFCDVVKA